MSSIVAQVILAAFLAAQAPAADVTADLQRRDQALLDALAPGDVKAWADAMAPDAVYVDENGEEMSRAAFLEQLKPLPPGASGTIKISKYSARFSGDVATVTHTDDEDEMYHGEALTAQYLTTETWQKQSGAWRLLMVHTYSVLGEPKSIALSASELDAYVGRYTGGSDLVYTITRDGDHLVGQREGRAATPLKAEVRDVFFVSGQLRIRKIFQRDSSGRVVGFADRREGSDLVWKRGL